MNAARARKWVGGFATIGTVLFPLAASLAAAGMPLDIEGDAKARLFWAAAALTVLAVASALTSWLVRRKQIASAEEAAKAARESAIEESTEHVLALTGAITPLSSCVAEMAISTGRVGRAQALGSLAQAAVQSLVQTAPGNCHAAIYVLEMEPAPTLKRFKYAGSGRQPRARFGVETADGLDALHMVLRRGSTHAPDAKNDPVVKPQGAYSCVMSVHIAAGDALYGMLTLDADEANALGDTEMEVLLSVANLLAAGFAM